MKQASDLPAAPYVLIRQARKGCDVVTVTAGSETATNYAGRTGRNDAKRAAETLARSLGYPLYNVKKGGRVVFCPYADPFAAATGTAQI